MSEQVKKTAVKDPAKTSDFTIDPVQGRGALAANVDVEKYLKAKEEVTTKDHADFELYLNERKQRDLLPSVTTPRQSKLDRRTILKVVTGTAVAGEAAALGYSWVTGGTVSSQAAAPAGRVSTAPQSQHIVRELSDSSADVGGRSLGKWILLLPTKLGGGTYAIDLNSNRVLASIWYWNYGDYSPISHHLCAFPSADPYHSFEFVNSTQGGKNSLIYGIPTRVQTPAPGFNIYRVRYDGAQMELLENVSETTGLGLGVHVTINPKDAQSFRHGRPKGYRGRLRPEFVQGTCRAEIRLGIQYHQHVGLLAEGRRPQDIENLSGRSHRQV